MKAKIKSGQPTYILKLSAREFGEIQFAVYVAGQGETVNAPEDQKYFKELYQQFKAVDHE